MHMTAANTRWIFGAREGRVDAISGILDAFRTHQIVALREGTHGNNQSHAVRLALIRDPRFATIGVAGGALHRRRVHEDASGAHGARDRRPQRTGRGRVQQAVCPVSGSVTEVTGRSPPLVRPFAFWISSCWQTARRTSASIR